MARAFVPVVLTANDLIEGDTVWWTAAGWSRDLAEALVFEAPEPAEAAEAALITDIAVVGLYRVEVRPGPHGPLPTLRREQIRAERRPTFDFAPDESVREAA
ncbi:MAG TPA: DUF2849 domain-containing protein [Paracoccaceae bacterium]|nr:DUF2849 domain-containing protein [Paracoccaceae bacterium]